MKTEDEAKKLKWFKDQTDTLSKENSTVGMMPGIIQGPHIFY